VLDHWQRNAAPLALPETEMANDPARTQRLLCASSCAYLIETSGPYEAIVPNTAPYVARYPAIGFRNQQFEVRGIARGAVHDTLGHHNIFAVLTDWYSDFDLVPVSNSVLPGKVHQGIARALTDLWDDLDNRIQTAITKFPDLPLVFTGHSKGGALANLAAMRFRLAYPHFVPPIIVETFAAPRCGNPDFAKAFNVAFPEAQRFEFGIDLVPHVPISALLTRTAAHLPLIADIVKLVKWDFQSVGTLRYIADDGSTVGDSIALEASRDQHLLAAALHFNWRGVFDAHSIGIGSGYARGVNLTIWGRRTDLTSTGASPDGHLGRGG